MVRDLPSARTRDSNTKDTDANHKLRVTWRRQWLNHFTPYVFPKGGRPTIPGSSTITRRCLGSILIGGGVLSDHTWFGVEAPPAPSPF